MKLAATVVRNPRRPSSKARSAYKKFGRGKRKGAWLHIEADRSYDFAVTKSNVKNGRPKDGATCPAANGLFASSLGRYTEFVEVGTTRVLLVNAVEKIVLKFYVGARLRTNIVVFDELKDWLETGTFRLDPVPPSLRSGYVSPGVTRYPVGVLRPRGSRRVYRVDSVTR